MTDSRDEEGKIQHKPGIFCCDRKQGGTLKRKKKIENMWACQKIKGANLKDPANS